MITFASGIPTIVQAVNLREFQNFSVIFTNATSATATINKLINIPRMIETHYSLSSITSDQH